MEEQVKKVRQSIAGGFPQDKVSELGKEYSSVRYLDSRGFGEIWIAQTREGQQVEYAGGGALDRLLKEQSPFSPERACLIAFDIASGVEYAHSQGVIHADLKPRNILLTKVQEAKITDWGLGRIGTSSSKSKGYTPG